MLLSVAKGYCKNISHAFELFPSTTLRERVVEMTYGMIMVVLALVSTERYSLAGISVGNITNSHIKTQISGAKYYN